MATLPMVHDAEALRQHALHGSPIIIAAAAGNIDDIKQLLGDDGTRDVVALLNAQYFNKTGSADRTPLMAAISNSQVATVAYLLSHGADPNYQDDDVGDPLIRAVNIKSLACVQLLLTAGANVNARLPSRPLTHWHDAPIDRAYVNECSPLGYATYHGDIGMVTALLEAKADVDAIGVTRTNLWHIAALCVQPCTPLTIAALMAATDIARLLLQHGASVDARHLQSTTPFHFACVQSAQPRNNKAVATADDNKEGETAGAAVVVDDDNKTDGSTSSNNTSDSKTSSDLPLSSNYDASTPIVTLASSSSSPSYLPSNHEAMLQLLVDHKADAFAMARPHIYDRYYGNVTIGMTPLSDVLQQTRGGEPGVYHPTVRFLMNQLTTTTPTSSSSSSSSSSDENKSSSLSQRLQLGLSLHIAVRHRAPLDVIQSLLDAKAPIEGASYEEKCSYTHEDTSTDYRRVYGDTPLLASVWSNTTLATMRPVTDLLLKHGANVHATCPTDADAVIWHTAIKEQSLSTSPSTTPCTPIGAAPVGRNLMFTPNCTDDIINYLASTGASVNHGHHSDGWYSTPLANSIRVPSAGQHRGTLPLLTNGADANAPFSGWSALYDHRWRPLHYVLSQPKDAKDNVVRALIMARADITLDRDDIAHHTLHNTYYRRAMQLPDIDINRQHAPSWLVGRATPLYMLLTVQPSRGYAAPAIKKRSRALIKVIKDATATLEVGALLYGNQPRLGADSSVFIHFRSSPLYDARLWTQIYRSVAAIACEDELAAAQLLIDTHITPPATAVAVPVNVVAVNGN